MMGALAAAGLVACGARAGKAPVTDAGTDAANDRAGDSAGASDASAEADAPADGAADVPAAVAAATAACRDAITAQCRRYAECRGGDAASCAAIVIDRCPSYYFNPRSLRTVAEIQACLPTFAAMTCTDLAMGLSPPCLRRGTGAVGAVCLYNTECQSGCVEGLDECGTCVNASRAATGEACDSTHFCGETDYCHTVSKTCAPKTSVVHAAEGQPCDFGAQPSVGCQGDLVCARTTDTGTAGICRRPPQLGEPCARSGDPLLSQLCGPGLACGAQMTCQVPAPIASGCGDGGACDDASFCHSGACVPRAPEGQLCRIFDTTEGPAIECTLGVWCVTQPDAGRNGVCTRPGALGDSCDVAHPCAGSLCGTAGRCTSYDPAACQPR